MKYALVTGGSYFPPNGISVKFFSFLLTIYKTEYPLFALL